MKHKHFIEDKLTCITHRFYTCWSILYDWRYILLKSIALFTCLLSTASLLSACDPNNSDSIPTDISDADATKLHNPAFCQRNPKPFVYSLCSVNQDLLIEPTGYELRLFWKAADALADNKIALHASSQNNELANNINNNDTNTSPLYNFNELKNQLPNTATLKFAANAGMYNSEFSPIGYTVLQGKEIRSLNLKQGGGNFHLLPNGVLWWDKTGKVSISESHALAKQLEENTAKPWYATQSGPMLVIDGHIHPKFNANSTSTKFRNGVGVCSDNTIKFVNSDMPVNFYQFASLFKDTLNCPNALFLDGGIASALYAPEIKQADDKSMGVMVGLIETQ